MVNSKKTMVYCKETIENTWWNFAKQPERWRKPLCNSLLILLSSARSSALLPRPQFQHLRMIGKLILLPRSFRETKFLMKIISWNRLPRKSRTISVYFHKRFRTLPRTWVSLSQAKLCFILIYNFLSWRCLMLLSWVVSLFGSFWIIKIKPAQNTDLL